MSPKPTSPGNKVTLTNKTKAAAKKAATKRKHRIAGRIAAARVAGRKEAVAAQSALSPSGKIETANANISRDWPVFTERLATAMSSMREDLFLIISHKHSKRFIQFAAQGAFGFRVEISSNAYLPPSDQLSDPEMKQLTEAGWQPPTGTPAESTPEKDPDGSPNFFIQYPASVESRVIAEQAVTVLARILRVPHPGFLAYKAFDDDGNALVLPDLGIKPEVQDGRNDLRKTAARLLAAVRKITGIHDLDYDADGDISVRYGSVPIFIRIVGSPAYVRVYAPLVGEVTESPQLHAHLNDLNSAVGHMHFFIRERTIFAISDVPASPLQYEHLATAIVRFSDIADGMDNLLEAEFGGLRVPSAHRKAALIN